MKLRSYSWVFGAVLLLGSAASSAAPSASTAAPTIYRWVDSDGVAHFTTELARVPKALRNRASELTPAPETIEARKDLPEKSKPASAAAESGGFEERNFDFDAAADTTANGENQSPPTPMHDSSADEARIAEIERQFAQDEETIKNWLIEPGADGTQAQFEAAARRLPTLQHELETLRKRRNASE